MIENSSVEPLPSRLDGTERRELWSILYRIKSYRRLPEKTVLLILSDGHSNIIGNGIKILMDRSGGSNDREPELLSYLERKVIDLYRSSVEKLDIDKQPTRSFESIQTNRGVLNISFFWEGLGGSESDENMSTKQKELKDVLQEILHTQKITAEANERAEKMAKENDRLIIKILDNLVPDSPHKDALRKVLSPS